jgi:hypothetical protein
MVPVGHPFLVPVLVRELEHVLSIRLILPKACQQASARLQTHLRVCGMC